MTGVQTCALPISGQASAHIPHLTVSHRPVFLLNSCLSLLSAAHSRGRPLSLSYRAILPSSLTMLRPPALGFSPHLPVSVYGTGPYHAIAAFLDSPYGSFATKLRSASRQALPCTVLPVHQALRLHRSLHSRLCLRFCVPTVLMIWSTGL